MTARYDVATILERETEVTIDNWYVRVEHEKEIISIPLTRKERCAHLYEMFSALVNRLRETLELGTHVLVSDAAHDHGTLRREQGYTAAMLVEESRLLQVSIFETLQWHAEDMNAQVLLLDVMSIADEVDAQLAQAMTSYISEAIADSGGAVSEQVERV